MSNTIQDFAPSSGDALLSRLYSFYKRTTMEIEFKEWPDIPDLLTQLNALQTEGKLWCQPIYTRSAPTAEREKPSGAVVRLTGKGLEAIRALKTTMKETTTVHRQVTIDGHKIDIRSAEMYSIIYGDVESLIESARAMCRQVSNELVYLKTRRQCQVILHKILRLRGQDIRQNAPEVYNEIVDAINRFIHAPSKPSKRRVAAEQSETGTIANVSPPTPGGKVCV
jgi:hypothetical protein